MALTLNRRQAGSNNQGQRKASIFDDLPLQRKGQYHFQLVKVGDKEDRAYNDPSQTVIKISFEFVQLIKGGDKLAQGATTEAAQRALLEKGHGRKFWLNANPIITPAAEGKRSSTLYDILDSIFTNGSGMGQDVVDALSTVGEDEELDAELGIIPIQTSHIKALHEAGILAVLVENGLIENERALLPALKKDGGSAVINALEGAQFSGFLGAKNGKNNLQNDVSLLPKDEYLPAYTQPAKAVDPRNADIDQSVVCEVCGEVITGYQYSRGPKAGSWCSQAEAVEQSRSKTGRVLCGRDRSASRTGTATTAVAGNPVKRIADEDLPF